MINTDTKKTDSSPQSRQVAAIGTPAYEEWLRVKRASKAAWFGYAPESGPSFD